MQLESWIERLNRLPSGLMPIVERLLRKSSKVNQELQKEYAKLLQEIEPSVKPYSQRFVRYSRLPEKGKEREQVLRDLEALQAIEEPRWKEGFVSGAVYHGDAEHIEFLNRIHALYSQSNPLHADIWPSSNKFEAEIVAMTANMLGGESAGEGVGGTVTSGGTESILLAMKAYRDWGREQKGIRRPEMVLPVTAHAAFDKAGKYFQIKTVRIPVDESYRADVRTCRKAITRNTVVIVGSAPSFPHGMIDPIQEMSELARERGIGFHTDACLGGFVLPWARRLGYPIPPFDFSLPGVTSISVDTHKYGYASKGTSVILYRNPELRHYQYYTVADWPGGLYFSPTFAGSRPGALIAAAWATLIVLGEEGYLTAAKHILETGKCIKEGIREIPQLSILGDPLWVIAFTSDELDIYRVLDFMTKRGWSLNGLHHPPAIHLCITLRHTQPGVAERFITDLKDAVVWVKENPQSSGGMAPVYGMAATMPLKGVVNDLLKRYIDLLYKV